MYIRYKSILLTIDWVYTYMCEANNRVVLSDECRRVYHLQIRPRKDKMQRKENYCKKAKVVPLCIYNFATTISFGTS